MSDDELKQMFLETRQDTRQMIGELREEMRAEFALVRAENLEMHAETRQMVTSLDGKLDTMVTSFDGKLDTTRRELTELIEDIDDKIQLIGEAVQMVDQRLTREAEDIRVEMRAGFAQLTSLNVRVTALEKQRR